MFSPKIPSKKEFLDNEISPLARIPICPENQAQSIAERLGVSTGKPLREEIVMESVDAPRFSSMTPKEEITKEQEINTFGYSLFKDSPTTFAPIDLAPAPLEYVMGPGDEIKIQLFGNKIISRAIAVNREGNLVIPELGVVQVSGLTFLKQN